jgi:hypothetical protein
MNAMRMILILSDSDMLEVVIWGVPYTCVHSIIQWALSLTRE